MRRATCEVRRPKASEPPSITEAELRAEMERLSKRSNADGLTAREIADKIGFSYETTIKVLRSLKEEGRIRAVKKTIRTLNDRSFLTDAYIVLPRRRQASCVVRPASQRKTKS